MEKTLQKVKVLQDENCHWYVIPNELEEEFNKDMLESEMIESGDFDEKYSEYRTNGDPNLIQFWAEI
jgi:hypothetical protein